MSIQKLGLLGPAIFLAACGGGGETVTPEDPFADALAATANYTPTYDDGVIEIEEALASDIAGDGVTGFFGNRDGTLSSFNVRVSEDGSTAFVSVDGGEEVVLPTRTRERPFGGGQWNNGTKFLTIASFDGKAIDVFFGGGGESSSGQGGLRTPVADLPTGQVTYNGGFDMNGDGFGDVDGDLTLNVAFGTGSVDGLLTGVAEQDVGADLDLSGTVEGEIVDGLLVGVITSTDPNALLELDMVGAVYQDGEQLNGAVAGSLNGNPLGGDFETEQE